MAITLPGWLEDVMGMVRLRWPDIDGLHEYEVVKPFPAADSKAMANPHYGTGGMNQMYLPRDPAWLLSHGYIRDAGITPLHNVTTDVPVKGIPGLRP